MQVSSKNDWDWRWPRSLTSPKIQWESSAVCGELLLAIGLSVYFIYHKINRHGRLVLLTDHYEAQRKLCSPLLQPSCPNGWSLQRLFWYRRLCSLWFLAVQLGDMVRTTCKCLFFFTSWNFIVQTVYFFKAATRTQELIRLEEQSTSRSMSKRASSDNSPLSKWMTQRSESLEEASSSSSTSSLTTPAAAPADSIYVSLLSEDHGMSYEPSTRTSQRQLRQSWLYLEVVFDVCLATSLLITIVVWTILYPYTVRHHMTEKLLNWASYCQHGGNLVLLQVDFWLSHHVVSVDAVPLLVLWPAVYAIFAWIVHDVSSQGFWPYPFMSMDTPMAPVWYACLLAGFGASFGVVFVFSRIKQSLLSR